jgi:alkanesulfonate monooxygenase
MSSEVPTTSVELFSACPLRQTDLNAPTYLGSIENVARWSERGGYRGTLIYTANNAEADPWLLAQVVLRTTETLAPLVAVQPVYMHPYTVAKMVSSLSNMYGRKIFLNMVAGGFKNDLVAMNDTTPHDRRYDRLVEYTTIIQRLLEPGSSVSFEGEFYSVRNLRLTPPLAAADLFPGFFISGSSAAGLAAAQAIGATVVRYPQPSEDGDPGLPEPEAGSGIRIGVIAREEEEEAWRVAHRRFPADRKGQVTHMLAMSTSDSVWHQQLSSGARDAEKNEKRSPYWMGPFESSKEYCPYLVGSYSRVARELSRFIAARHRTYILDIPPDDEESRHVNRAFRQALGSLAP